MFDAVIFDLDGTLVTRDQEIGAVYDRAFERVGVERFGEPDDLWAALDGPPDPDDQVDYLAAGFARLAAQHDRDVDPTALAAAFVEGVDNGQVSRVDHADAALDAAAGTGAVGLLIRIAVPVYRSDHPKAGGRCGNDVQRSV